MKILHRLTGECLYETETDNLSGADLFGADLARADLSGANLSRADLSGANLSKANLFGADLSRADLSRADLSGANLSGANLSKANLSGANLSGADLFGADLFGVVGNGKEMLSMQIGKWPVTYWNNILQIGCQRHTVQQWAAFDDAEIAQMAEGALDWWKANKDAIFLLIGAKI